jgi:hypothetical protein
MKGDIYSRARQVTVHLGDDKPGDNKAFKLLDILAAARKETRPIAGEGNRYQIPDPDQLKALGVPSIDAPEWTNLVELFRRPYFRMWIQQEVAMSADATVLWQVSQTVEAFWGRSDVSVSFTWFMIGKEMSLKILGAREDPMLIAQVSERTPFVGGGLDCRMPHSATRFNYKFSNFHAGGDTIPKVSLLDGNILSVRGAIIDRVGNVGSYFQARFSTVDDLAVPQDWEEMFFGVSVYPTGEDRLWVFFNILTCAREKRQLYVPFLCWLRLNGRLSQTHGVTLTGEVERQSEADLMKYSRLFLFSMMDSSNGTSSLTTAKGYAGTGPSTESQDLVCILDGAPMPFIMRCSKQDENYYELIGECYIQGIMDGKAVAAGDLLHQDFLLR